MLVTLVKTVKWIQLRFRNERTRMWTLWPDFGFLFFKGRTVGDIIILWGWRPEWQTLVLSGSWPDTVTYSCARTGQQDHMIPCRHETAGSCGIKANRPFDGLQSPWRFSVWQVGAQLHCIIGQRHAESNRIIILGTIMKCLAFFIDVFDLQL